MSVAISLKEHADISWNCHTGVTRNL